MTRCILLFVLFAALAAAQPSFEVASVKVASGQAPQTLRTMHGGPGTGDPTRFTWTRVNLATLLMRAYGVRMDQISGPDWIKDFSNDRTMYTISALIPPGSSKDQFNLMLRNLLTERFHLAIHHEAKEFPGYELILAAGTGPKIKPCSSDESASFASGIRDEDINGCPALPRDGSMTTSLSSRMGTWGTIRQRFIMSMAEFAVSLGTAINEANGVEASAATPRVIDKTGLTGTYEFTLEFTGIIVMPGLAPPPGGAGDSPSGPTLYNALEKQLGLKLLKTKNAPVDILVVDHADKVPAQN